MAERRPKVVRLYDGGFCLVPAKTQVLNPEREGETLSLCYMWATPGEGTNPGSLDGAFTQDDIALYAWLTDDELAMAPYRGGEEFEAAVARMLERLDSDIAVWDVALADTMDADEAGTIAARFSVERAPQG